MATLTINGQGGIVCAYLQRNPDDARDGEVNIRHIPGGNAYYVDKAGLAPPMRSATLRFIQLSDWQTVRDNVGQDATLSYIEDALGNPTTISLAITIISAQRKQVSGRGDHIADIKFVVLV